MTVIALAIRCDEAFRQALFGMLDSVELLALEADSTGELIEQLRSTASIRAIVYDPDLDPYGRGFEHAADIRRQWPDVCLVMLAQRAGSGERLRGLMSGADRYIARPCSPLRVAVELCRLLGIDPRCIHRPSACETSEVDVSALLESDRHLRVELESDPQLRVMLGESDDGHLRVERQPAQEEPWTPQRQ